MKIKNLVLSAMVFGTLAGYTTASLAAAEDKPFQLQGLTEADYHPGTTQYLVYMRDSESGKMMRMELWNRTTSIIEKDGQKLVEVKQDWHITDAVASREIYSLNRLDTFAPVFHQTMHGDDKTVSAYRFDGSLISGDKSVDGNSKADFQMPMQPETLNWELDMETFGLLPLEKGRTFKLNFYHPGAKKPPTVYDYTVTGDETLTDMRGNALPCWILHIQYGDDGDADFWIDKATGQTIKMAERWGKIRRYKVRLGVPVEQ